MVTRSEESITLNGILPFFLTMVADPSRPLMMTINVSFIMTCFPKIVIQNGGKNALWEGRESGTMTRSEESITLNGILPVFLTMVADPSHSLRMTPYRPSSF